MYDLYGDEMARHNLVIDTLRRIARLYCFNPVATPVIEYAELFARSLGAASDVIHKEMFTLAPRSGSAEPGDDGALALRPEGTAGVARLLASGRLAASPAQPARLWYAGPMFRYERPQAGRQRQFAQAGVECVGSAAPAADALVVRMAVDVLAALGLRAAVRLELNTLGDEESARRYETQLTEYWQAHRHALSPLSQARLAKGAALRILDSKEPADSKLIANAPLGADSRSAAASERFGAVCAALNAAGVAYELNPRLVRGLDYYSHTVFEFVSLAARGKAQAAVLAGGHYANLVAALGGDALPGVGWAAGVERLAALLGPRRDDALRPVAVVDLSGSPAAAVRVGALEESLRARGVPVLPLLDAHATPSKRLQRAAKAGAAVALLVARDGALLVRRLDDGKQTQHSDEAEAVAAAAVATAAATATVATAAIAQPQG